MNSKRPLAEESESSHRAKRRLVESLQQLSLTHNDLKNSEPAVKSLETTAYNDSNYDDYMDVYKPNTEFIFDIDRFLKNEDGNGNEEEQIGDGIIVNRRFFKVPTSVLFKAERLHFYQRLTKQLIGYIPGYLLLYNNVLKWASRLGLFLDYQNEQDMELEDPRERSESLPYEEEIYQQVRYNDYSPHMYTSPSPDSMDID